MAEDRWLVVGLGNPGRRYADTRHNAGFMVLDVLAGRAGGKFKSFKGGRRLGATGPGGSAEIVETQLAGQPAAYLKSRAYMNVSGPPVASARDFFKVPTERVVVVHDELDLPFGVLRLKRGGGGGGHNGLRSVSQALGSPDFLRVRFGIGRPPGRTDPVSYVLAAFGPAERKELGVHLEQAADAVEVLCRDGLEVAQNTYHGM